MRRPGAWVTVGATALLLLSAAAPAADLGTALKLFRAEDHAAAEAELRAVLAEAPEDLSARFWLGRALLEQGKPKEAADELQAVVTKKPDSVDSRLWLSVALSRQGRQADARRQLEQLLAREPNHQEARELLAQVEEPSTTPASLPPPGRAASRTASQSRRIGLSVDGLALDVGQVDVLSHNVYDYTFTTAPTDWVPRTGTWKATNRWDCSPQWTWY
ncbi:MAG: tetratricopeptide repeat protein, partial [Armatimonadetes bacterium]|nr:tetratricopeptide repeat protein [Armatimonadota bacterium]